MFKRILIPTDGSTLAMKAARAGLTLAKGLNAEVVGCCMVEALQPVFGPRSAVSKSMIAEYNQRVLDAGSKHVDAVARLAAKMGVSFTPVVSPDYTPAEGIVHFAKKHKCDAIVIATHGRSGLSRLAMGSVTQKVLSMSRMPVVVCR